MTLDDLLKRHPAPWTPFPWDRHDIDRGWQVIDAVGEVVASEMDLETAEGLSAIPDQAARMAELEARLVEAMAWVDVLPNGIGSLEDLISVPEFEQFRERARAALARSRAGEGATK